MKNIRTRWMYSPVCNIHVGCRCHALHISVDNKHMWLVHQLGPRNYRQI